MKLHSTKEAASGICGLGLRHMFQKACPGPRLTALQQPVSIRAQIRSSHCWLSQLPDCSPLRQGQFMPAADLNRPGNC